LTSRTSSSGARSLTSGSTIRAKRLVSSRRIRTELRKRLTSPGDEFGKPGAGLRGSGLAVFTLALGVTMMMERT
jgi:hypothetical protein